MEKIEFKTIKSDNRLTKLEIKEVEQLSKNQEKIKILAQTDIEFKNFINTDYRYANEGYLRKNGKTVKNLQIKLGLKGKGADGIFGKNTFIALIKYQKENGLRVDGLAGKNTQIKLFGTKKLQQISERNRKLENSGNKFNAGKELVAFIEKKGRPRGARGQCGANVGNILLQSGIKGLPNSGRDGYKWNSFLKNNPNFIQEYISSPENVKPGGILIYGQKFGNGARQKYGHVEIALGGGQYYYGMVKNHPGGSIDARKYKSGFTGIVYYPKNYS